MQIQNKITFLLIASIFSYFISSNCAIYSRAGGLRGGPRGDSFDNKFDNRDDSFYRGDADRDHADLNNLDHDAGMRDLDTRFPLMGNALSRSVLNGDVGHITHPVADADMADRAALVRNNYAYADVYNRNFWVAHPEAGWAYANRWGDNWAWGYTDWPALAGWWGMPVTAVPTNYDYGNNITYQNENIYYGSQPVDTAVAYYGQAQTLAQSVPISPKEINNKNAWKPLGVFSMVQGDQTNTNCIFQLAVNKAGAIKGSYYNPLTGETKPLAGAVDKKNMRASWIIGEDKNVVYDTGLNNLLQAQSQMLVHYGKDKSQQWSLVRLQQNKVS